MRCDFQKTRESKPLWKKPGHLKHQRSMAVYQFLETSDSVDFVKSLAPLVSEEKIVCGHHQKTITTGTYDDVLMKPNILYANFNTKLTCV